MSFRVTTVIENETLEERSADLVASHGFSALVEGPDARVLYDAGPTPRFLMNARALGLDLTHLAGLVLSHGHWDHTGGAAAFLAGGYAPERIFAGPGFFDLRYRVKNGGMLENGSLLTPEMVKTCGVPLTVTGPEPIRIGTGIFALSGFRQTEAFEPPAESMKRKTAEGFETDTFPEETVLVLEGDEGLTVVSGCSHVGVVSICRRVSEVFGKRVYRMIGGTHLCNSDEERIRKTSEALRAMGVRSLGACHCTGKAAESYFGSHFPGFFRNSGGLSVVIP